MDGRYKVVGRRLPSSLSGSHFLALLDSDTGFARFPPEFLIEFSSQWSKVTMLLLHWPLFTVAQ